MTIHKARITFVFALNDETKNLQITLENLPLQPGHPMVKHMTPAKQWLNQVALKYGKDLMSLLDAMMNPAKNLQPAEGEKTDDNVPSVPA